MEAINPAAGCANWWTHHSYILSRPFSTKNDICAILSLPNRIKF
jgi:hypothetical protein